MANVKANWDDLSDDETSTSISTSNININITNDIVLKHKNVINDKTPLPPIPTKRKIVKKPVHAAHSRLKSTKKKLEDVQNQEGSQDDDDNIMYDYETERMDKKFGTHFTLKK